MKKAFGEYQRLARGSLGCSSLWLGGDHLLYIKGNGFLLPFSEEYKRFRYADIQAVVLARTSGLRLGALAYLAGLAIAGSICFAMLFFREPGDSVMLALTLALPLPVAVGLLILLVRHLLLGPRCVCEVQTAVKRERLRPVNRMHRGRQLLAKLGERIRPTQADLVMAVEEGDPVPHSAPPAIPELRLPPLALITFAWQALIGGLLLALLHFPSLAISAAWIGLTITGFAPLLISIAGGVRHLCPDSIRQVLWFQLTTSLILGAIAFVYFVDQAINDPLVTIGMTGPIEAFSDIGASSAFAYYLAFLAAAIFNLAAAITGLVLHVRWKGHLSASPSGVSIHEGSVSDDTLS